MKRFIYFMVSLMTIVMFISCSAPESNEISYLPFKSSADGKWGLISTDGTVLFEEEFKHEPTVVMNDRFMVKNGNGNWEIYTASEKPEKIGEDYIGICDFTADVTPAVKKNEKIKLIDKNGKEVAILDKIGNKNIVSCSKFKYGYAVVRTEDRKEGIINTKGEKVVDAKYDHIGILSSNHFLAMDEDDNGTSDVFPFTVLDTKGNVVSSMSIGKGQKYTFFSEDHLKEQFEHEKHISVCTTVDGEVQWGLIDLNFEVKVKPSSKIKGLHEVKDDKFIYYNGENFGVMGFDGNVVIRPKYDMLQWASKTLLVAYNSEDGYMLINLEGDKLTKEKYLAILPFYNGKIAPAKVDDNSWTFINTNGEEEKIKNLPDIYHIEENYACDVVESDFVDIDAIVGTLQLAKNGMMGFNMDLSPQQVVKAYIESEFKCDATITTDTDVIDRLYFGTEKNGIDISGQFRSRFYLKYGEWSDYIEYLMAEIKGYRLDSSKIQSLYSKIAAIVKSYGKVYRENSGAVIVKISDSRGWLVANRGDCVFIELISTGEYKDITIDEYAKNGEATHESEESQRARHEYEVADTIAADTVY